MAIVLAALLLVLQTHCGKKGVVCVPPCSANTLSQLRAQWYYNYETRAPFSTPVEFVPMVFSPNKLDDIPGYSTHLLGFNEPDLRGTSPQEAASSWPTFVKKSNTRATPSPAKNPAAPDSWLSQFMKIVDTSTVTYIGLHRYNTTNPDSFKASVTATYTAFKKPIWITQFACQDDSESTSTPFPQSDVNKFIEQVIPWLEQTSFISHYAWHSASGGTSALWRADGTLTQTGMKYASVGGFINATQSE